MTRTPAICILNAYPKETRDAFDRSQVGHPHNFYRDFISRALPHAKTDIFFAADAKLRLPAGTSFSSYAGCIWTGSDLTIYHNDDVRVSRQIELAKTILKAGVPCFGSCWGIQLAAVIAGGEVQKNPKGREWGLARNIRKTPAGKKSLLLKGKPDCYDGFAMHLDEVTRLPANVVILATNEHTKVQALSIQYGGGVFWSTQYHPEYNLFEMARLITARSTPLIKEGFFSTTAEVKAYANKMVTLHKNNNLKQKNELKINQDVLDQKIREQELRNWIQHLVISSC